MADEKKISFQKTISLGNLLSMATMVFGGVAVYVQLEIANTRQDAAIAALERRLSVLETNNATQQTATIATLAAIQARLASMERDEAVSAQKIIELIARFDRLSAFIVRKLGDGVSP